MTQQLQRDFKDVCNGIGCFDGTFSLEVRPNSKPYQAPLRNIAYALQKPLKEELESSTARHHSTTRHGWDSRMVQQLDFSTEIQMERSGCAYIQWDYIKHVWEQSRGPSVNDFFHKAKQCKTSFSYTSEF